MQGAPSRFLPYFVESPLAVRAPAFGPIQRMHILFVCTGNSCRSVMAECLFNHLAKERGLAGWEARSCGVAAERSFPIPSGVRKAMSLRGIARVDHVPQLVTRELLDWADAVVPVTRGHLELLLDKYPESSSKTRLFSEMAGWATRDIDDPIGQPDSVYLACADILEAGTRSILERHGTQKPQTERS